MISGQDTSEAAEGQRRKDASPDEQNARNSRATRNWTKLKDIVNKTNKCDGESKQSSMTEQERAFLKMRNTSKSFRSQKSRIIDIVEAAVAREKLRKELKARLSKLTNIETQFLSDIVDDEDVTEQQLLNADHVLRTDPLYKLPHEEEDYSDEESEGIQRTREIGLVASESRARDIDVSYEALDVNIDISQQGVELILGPIPKLEKEPMHPKIYSYKTWDTIKDQYQEYPILGVSQDLIDETSRVLSPPMLDSLRKSLPYAVAEDNFWLKFNLSKDGASLDALYQSIRQSSETILAIETFDGEVFGAFVSSPWRRQKGFYGSCEAFVWKMKESRYTATNSIEEQIRLESDISVFKWSQENRNIQMSDRTKIAIGGGIPENGEEKDWGLGIALDDVLYQGSTSPCITFRSPNLVSGSSQGDLFNVSNLEVWTLTPCWNEKEAEQLELGRMFVLSHFDHH